MLNRDATLRSILVVVLLCVTGCQSNGAASMTPAGQMQRAASAWTADCQPDFALTLNPTSATIASGQSVRVSVQFASICSLAGSINFGIHSSSPQPRGGDGYTLRQPRYDIPLDANSTAVGYITLGATPSTLKTTWALTIQGKDVSGGCCYGLTHSAVFALTVR
ncbi:MAG TPA: hypothetical protein VIW73_04040 [Candidatus Cybelea sp.]